MPGSGLAGFRAFFDAGEFFANLKKTSMEQQISSYVFLTGPRSVRFYPGGEEYAAGLPSDTTRGERLQSALCGTVRRLYAEGYRTFSVALEEGFGLGAANLVQTIREHDDKCPGIRLQVYYVYEGQHTRSDALSRTLFEDIVQRADSAQVCLREAIPTKEQYQALLHELSLSLTSRCSRLVCCDDGTQKSAASARSLAEKKGIPVLNLFDELNKKAL